VANETAFVLDDEGLAGGGPVNLAGFPGMWTPGEPIAAAEFVKAGAFDSVQEMRDRVRELGMPLKEVTVGEGTAPIAARANHMPNAEEAAEAKATLETSTPRSHAEADQAAAELGLDFPAGTKLADKVEAIRTALDPGTGDATEKDAD
jgi:hypothetical protein